MQKTVVILTSDISGKPAARTVPFAIDGTQYEIELTSQEITEFRGALAEFVTHARVNSVKADTAKAERDLIRAWAKERGIPIQPRGKIAENTIHRYRAEH